MAVEEGATKALEDEVPGVGAIEIDVLGLTIGDRELRLPCRICLSDYVVLLIKNLVRCATSSDGEYVFFFNL